MKLHKDLKKYSTGYLKRYLTVMEDSIRSAEDKKMIDKVTKELERRYEQNI